MILYAYDSIVFVSANKLEEASHIIQKDLSNVGIWCKFHKLSINVNKTKAMHFGVRETEPDVTPSVEIANNRIDFVNSYK